MARTNSTREDTPLEDQDPNDEDGMQVDEEEELVEDKDDELIRDEEMEDAPPIPVCSRYLYLISRPPSTLEYG